MVAVMTRSFDLSALQGSSDINRVGLRRHPRQGGLAALPPHFSPSLRASSPSSTFFSASQLPPAQAARTRSSSFSRSRLCSVGESSEAAPAADTTKQSTDESGGALLQEKEAAVRLADDPVLLARAARKSDWAVPDPTVGEQIFDVLYVFGGLLDRPFGSGASMAAAGSVVIERVRSEVQKVIQQGPAAPNGADQTLPTQQEPDEGGLQISPKQQQAGFEILRLMQLLAMDMELVRAAVKEETLLQRLEQAKGRCKLAMQLARQLQ